MREETYNLLKIWGWVWLEQGRSLEADESLLKAIGLEPQQPGAYCLRARVLEATQTAEPDKIRQSWGNCLVGDRQQQPEEATWAALARGGRLQP